MKLFLSILVFTIALHLFFARNIPVIIDHGVSVQVSDLSYHLILAQGFWDDHTIDVYQPAIQQSLLSSYFQREMPRVMPVGVTPLAFVLWGPFVLLSRWDLRVAYSAWESTALLVFGYAFWGYWKRATANNERQLLFVGLVLVIFSETMARTIVLGQTSLLALSVLMLLELYSRQENEERTARDLAPWARPLMLLFCSFKPSYLLFGSAILVRDRRWKDLCYGFMALFVLMFTLVLWHGTSLLSSYMAALRAYTSPVIPEVYRGALDFEMMNIFRSAFAGYLPEAMRIQISILFGMVVPVVFIAALFLIAGEEWILNRKVLCLAVFVFALLFAPYLQRYEDLLLFVPFLMTIRPLRLHPIFAIGVLVCLFASWNFSMARELFQPELLWEMKMLALVMICWFSRAVPRTVPRML